MSSATAILRREHTVIGRAIDVTLELARRLENNQPLPVVSLSAVLQFFSFVAHRSHRDKEEELLFPALRNKGFYEGPGCVGVLLDEHGESAQAFMQMVALAEAYEHGDHGAGHEWAHAARRYAEDLRRHIRREDDVLLMNAERVLTDADQQELAQEFTRIDDRANRAGLEEIIQEFERVATEVGR